MLTYNFWSSLVNWATNAHYYW